MAKSATIKDNKWVGTIFENEDLVDLMIPLDPLNKSKHMFVCITDNRYRSRCVRYSRYRRKWKTIYPSTH